MTTLSDLKQKWFLDVHHTSGNMGGIVPLTRYPGSTISDSTDNNLVIPLIDGQNFTAKWHQFVSALHGPTANGAASEMLFSGFMFGDVRTLGHSNPASSSLAILKAASGRGAIIHLLLSGGLTNVPAVIPVLDLKVLHGLDAIMDDRFSNPVGCNHSKYSIFIERANNTNTTTVLLGSVDIHPKRWDRSFHLAVEPERAPGCNATHDLGVMLEGPAVYDVQRSFLDRWNDTRAGWSGGSPLPPVSPTSTAPGSHSVQVLTTYGKSKIHNTGYSWTPTGDFTIWAAYLKAIDRATKYIYIEDQFFFPFFASYPSTFLKPGGGQPWYEDPNLREADIVYRLGRAIVERGVQVIVVVPNLCEDGGKPGENLIMNRRNTGVRYLQNVAAGSKGSFTIASPYSGSTPYYVHSKLLICDDEYVLVGSANVNQKSMTHDGELSIGIVDAKEVFARNLRTQLWAEHLMVNPTALQDPVVAIATFKKAVADETGRLRAYKPATFPITQVLSGMIPGPAYMVDVYSGP